MKDIFSGFADQYAQYRPGYPQALFDFIISVTRNRDLAWDCGTGNGQSAICLSKYFKEVYATDISQQQLDNAHSAENISYVTESSDKTMLADNSTDLVTISQALHWFNFDAFYAEVKRTGKKNAVIAAWTYSLLQAGDIDPILQAFHFEKLKNYWDPERSYVNEGYKNIPFPFTAIPAPSFFIEVIWTTKELEGYLNTWSAVKKYITTHSLNPVTEVMQKVRELWPGQEARTLIFPIHLKVGYVH